MQINRREILISAAASFGLFAAFFFLTWALAPSFEFNRWDNFEYYTPTIFETHRLWWSGRIPYWSPWQHMGEPLFANAQPGALYFPFTLIAGFFLLFGISPHYFALGVIASHVPLMIFGWSLFLRSRGLSRAWALAGGLAASTCGTALCYQSFWFFTVPFLTLLPWAVLGFTYLETRWGAWLGFFTFTLAAWLGHFQFTVYLYAAVLIYAAIMTRAWLRIALITGASILAGMPAILTIFEIVKHTVRARNMPIETFLEAAVPVKDLLAMLFPFFYGQEVMYSGPMIFFASAPWLLLGLVAGFAFLKRRDFWALFAAGFLFLLFSLGKNGGLLPLTFGLPVWSSFRFPHKFAPFAVALLSVAAAVGGARLQELERKKRLAFGGGYLALLVVGVWAFSTVSGENLYIYAAAIAGWIAWLMVPWSWLLLGATFAASLALSLTAQEVIPKKYLEPYASVGVAELGLEENSRVFPLSLYARGPLDTGPTFMQQHGIFQSATMNHYESLTGHTSPLAVTWFLEYLPSDAWGVLPRPLLGGYLRSGLFPLWSVDTLLVDPNDSQVLNFLATLPDLHLAKTLSRIATFHYTSVQPKFYLAGEVRKFNHDEFLKFYEHPNTPVAFVEDAAPAQSPVPGEILKSHVEPGGTIDVETRSAAAKTLVMNYTYYPQWHAYVNGAEMPLHRANGMVMALALPAGENQIHLVWKSLGLELGFVLFALGAGIMVFLTSKRFKKD